MSPSPHVVAAQRLTHAGARVLSDAAIAAAQEFRIAISIAVVDAGGHVLVLERMDGGRFHSVHSATTKAVTAASNRRPTTSQGAQGQALDTAHAVGLALAAGPTRWTAMEGGFPILVGEDCVGGIGISGGDWEQDQAIARAALAAIGIGR